MNYLFLTEEDTGAVTFLGEKNGFLHSCTIDEKIGSELDADQIAVLAESVMNEAYERYLQEHP